jgi:hypothetical protein
MEIADVIKEVATWRADGLDPTEVVLRGAAADTEDVLHLRASRATGRHGAESWRCCGFEVGPVRASAADLTSRELSTCVGPGALGSRLAGLGPVGDAMAQLSALERPLAALVADPGTRGNARPAAVAVVRLASLAVAAERWEEGVKEGARVRFERVRALGEEAQALVLARPAEVVEALGSGPLGLGVYRTGVRLRDGRASEVVAAVSLVTERFREGRFTGRVLTQDAWDSFEALLGGSAFAWTSLEGVAPDLHEEVASTTLRLVSDGLEVAEAFEAAKALAG